MSYDATGQSEGGMVFHTHEDSEIISEAVTAAILGQIQAPGLAVEDREQK